MAKPLQAIPGSGVRFYGDTAQLGGGYAEVNFSQAATHIVWYFLEEMPLIGWWYGEVNFN